MSSYPEIVDFILTSKISYNMQRGNMRLFPQIWEVVTLSYCWYAILYTKAFRETFKMVLFYGAPILT